MRRQRERIPEARIAAHLREVVEARETREPGHAEVEALQAVPAEVDERRRRRQHRSTARAREAKQREREAALLRARACAQSARRVQPASPSGSARCAPAPRRALPSASSGRPAPTGWRWPWCRRWPATAARAAASRRRCRCSSDSSAAGMKLSPASFIAAANSGDFQIESRLTPERLAGPANFHDVRACVSARGRPRDEQPGRLLLLLGAARR